MRTQVTKGRQGIRNQPRFNPILICPGYTRQHVGGGAASSMFSGEKGQCSVTNPLATAKCLIYGCSSPNQRQVLTIALSIAKTDHNRGQISQSSQQYLAITDSFQICPSIAQKYQQSLDYPDRPIHDLTLARM